MFMLDLSTFSFGNKCLRVPLETGVHLGSDCVRPKDREDPGDPSKGRRWKGVPTPETRRLEPMRDGGHPGGEYDFQT